MRITVEIEDDDVRRVLGLLIHDLHDPTTSATNEKLLSVADVAYRLGISRPKVYDLIARGQLEAMTVGATKRISETALDDFMATSHTTPRPTRNS